MKDKEIERLIKLEEKRQNGVINLIASENYVSRDVLMALGSVFTNKYSEGYPGKRYYGGNEIVDKVENLAKERALKLFGLSKNKWSVNVQPYSGSPANLAIYLALVPIGQKIMGMSLSMGGHLTHGHKVSATGKLWKWIHFGVSKKTELLDYYEIRRIARCEKPKMIVAGFTAYPRVIDFKKLRKICDEVGAIFMVDMSHFAGLVAGGAYPSPFPHADVVMTTTHKTLCGPRAAIIFSRKIKLHASSFMLHDLIDRAVFPGLQGGPHINQIAAIAVCLKEAATPAFKKYAKQVVKNAKVLAKELQKKGWRIVSGGTDSHLFLVDTWARGISGKTAQELLEAEKIIVNKNTIPFDTRSPFDPSGIRIGTAAVTTQGMKEKDMIKIAQKIDKILKSHGGH
ncbi:serine hydroxymethyltransferase [Candidatus Giovannonibacteria bacterium RIFCSPLOWO2_01_FULL_44_40]|uniref:Serine hydroxymethyltransferase n=1 Tax=Candidatus Giovannonibacteria bacterium RIFCSPHIGHO2_01_FULL_45_23 TaxID=1798325 RepID=A0A1F5VHI9_9BACT|nr:MAG: serine hydroxymethyltransferase [Candidatus Giovannonibacteria bacterium RIFCSPHIGHO2_01_FULL_45_23]OGF75580.1 MAG: serine hydroxymethyltransferase [Candidatus Giovannonibacteria bacterium RIFCSPHIGHO2_02_FULL_45_13]OGF79998.1 MAG: serine hydroxymethyltransferase [Candidatus Giovannonibacteria bacterium RIFCSPLOWO2_01_FULL_44_40]